MRPMHRLLLVGLSTLVSLAASCGSPGPKGAAAPPVPTGLIFTESYHPRVEAHAFFPNGGQTFRDGDRKLRFAQRQNLIPIGVRIGLDPAAPAGGSIALGEPTESMRLLLPDGTVLAPKAPLAITGAAKDSEADAIRALCLGRGALGEFSGSAPPTFVFFEGPPDYVWAGDASIRYARDGIVYEAELMQTILMIELKQERMDTETVYVGVRLEG